MNVAEDTLSPQRYSGSYISFDAFSMVGRSQMLGRGFRPDDDRADAPPVVIITHTLWQNRYSGDPSVIGRTVRVNEIPTTIIGVMPEGFQFPIASELWVPVAQRLGPPSSFDATRGNRGVLIFAFGRLGRGEAEMFQRDAVKHLSALVLMELRAGAFALRDRRLVQRVESSFAKAGRILVPSQTVFVEAGDALRRLQESRGFRLETSHSIVNDVLIALSARSIGATVVTQNEGDYRAIQAVRPFQLLVVR